jgi:hypothetical protein
MSMSFSVCRRRTAVVWSIAVASALVVDESAGADQAAARMDRVRSEVPVINAAISRGTERSPTFRRLVETIGNSDGIVYVQEGKCGINIRACLQLWVGVAEPNRLLRIRVSSRKAPGCQLAASIGHELQHAIEVLSDPKIRNFHDMFNFFNMNGRTGYGTFETDAAQQIGLAIFRETC